MKTEVWKINQFRSQIVDAKSAKKFTKKALAFQKVYCSNNILGQLKITAVPPECILELTEVYTILSPNDFNRKDKFNLARSRGQRSGGRVRSRAGNPLPPQTGPTRRPYVPGGS